MTEKISKLIEKLRNGNARECDEALAELISLGKHAVPHVIPLLKDEKWGVRLYAAIALDKAGSKEAVEPLIEALAKEDERHEVINAIEGALGDIRDSRAVAPLIRSLRKSPVRVHPANALAKIGKPAVRPLIKLLDDEKPNVRAFAAQTLCRIGDPAALAPISKLLSKETNTLARRIIAKSLGLMGEPALPLLIAAMPTAKREVYLEIRDAFVRESVKAVPLLIAELSSNTNDAWARECAVEMLGVIGDKRAVEPLIALRSRIDEDDSNLERAVLIALGRTRDARAIQFLIDEFVQHSTAPERVVHVYVKDALVEAGAAALPLLAKAFQEQKLTFDVVSHISEEIRAKHERENKDPGIVRRSEKPAEMQRALHAVPILDGSVQQKARRVAHA